MSALIFAFPPADPTAIRVRFQENGSHDVGVIARTGDWHPGWASRSGLDHSAACSHVDALARSSGLPVTYDWLEGVPL